MSYARWTSDSEVYAFLCVVDGVDVYQCHCCKINRGRSLNFKTLIGLKTHFLDHRERGDKVPQYAFDQIDYEIEHPEDPDRG